MGDTDLMCEGRFVRSVGVCPEGQLAYITELRSWFGDRF